MGSQGFKPLVKMTGHEIVFWPSACQLIKNLSPKTGGVDLVFHNAAQTLQENECFALAYLNDRTVNKIKSIQAMPCDEIEKTMAYWTSVNDVKGMRFIPNPEPPIR